MISMNTFASTKPMSPQPGKVRTHVSAMSLATCQLTCLTLLAAPAPMMDAVLVCVVETGRPQKVEARRLMPDDSDAAAPWYL